jgi:hypothetical protein
MDNWSRGITINTMANTAVQENNGGIHVHFSDEYHAPAVEP